MSRKVALAAARAREGDRLLQRLDARVPVHVLAHGRELSGGFLVLAGLDQQLGEVNAGEVMGRVQVHRLAQRGDRAGEIPHRAQLRRAQPLHFRTPVGV